MKKQYRATRAPQKLQAIQTSRHLHVAHRRHTGHIIPKRNTSYAVLAMILLCVGVLLHQWTRIVSADDSSSYVVHASVPGPPPTTAATIDSPLTGITVTSSPIDVSGTCPVGTYEEVLRNNFSSGIALCDASGTYHLQIALFEGINQLIVRDYSFTDQAGPDSGITTVIYNPPVATGGGGTTGSTSSGSAPQQYNPGTPGIPEPLVLKTNYTFLGYYAGDPAHWIIHVEGGTAPYAISVDWGDGKTQLYSVKDASDVSIQHVYTKIGGYHGSYPVKITAIDVTGGKSFLQLLAIISNKPKTVFLGTTGSSGPGTWLSGISISRAVTYMWSTYGIVLLMLASFWLGERRELFSLRRHGRLKRHA
jgi:hypothetical protein